VSSLDRILPFLKPIEDLLLDRHITTVTLRAHRLAWKRDAEAPAITVFGARVKYKSGPFTLCREYAAPDG
jgi:hypothetical protein